MSTKCFVPNCKNTVGVPFPKHEVLKKLWLNSLKIKHVVPSSASFVCLEHFDETDFHDTQSKDGDGEPEKQLRNDAVPKMSPTKKMTENHASPNDDKIETDDDISTALQNHENIEIEHHESDESCDKTFVENCRLCMRSEDLNRNIFDKIDLDDTVTIITAIKSCLHPLKIHKNDDFPKKICNTCFTSLNNCYSFKTMCIATDAKRRKLFKENESRKRSADEIDVRTRSSKHKKLCMEIANDDSEICMEDFLAVKNETDDPMTGQKSKKTVKTIEIKCPSPPAERQTSELSKIIKISKPSSSKAEIDKKFDRVEAELRRVLEGKLTDEQISAENIIIAVTSDDENEEKQPTKVVMPVKDENEPMSKLVKIEGDQEVQITTGNIIFPKCIRITTPEKFESDVGIYKCILKKYVYDFQFCEVDGYLLEFRLQKGSLRYLRCINGSCRCTAVQNKIEPAKYSDEVTVQHPHNHKRPTTTDMKKQMFYHVMKKKMQADKSLNFRHVYDEVCDLDTEIRELVPLRNVINEMCRHQLTFKCPKISSFENFYQHIEEDSFQKLHFTHNGKQFYQERFETEDDTKAIVFANCDVIEEISHSKLMYVDASFKIDTNEDFKYQLVTILVWIEESYYPIAFALVSRKTQEIYKKVFEYLHDVLAPKLRPDEIVTDYEANLYYALGETYLDSHIGGSVFYYTQNLYKKICALNLSRDLETNSYFRSIYHMLLMLPLLPVNTILDGLNNIEIQSRDLGLTDLTRPIFNHVRNQWIIKVTPDLFCVHRLENRINENVIAPFKKLRDFLMLSKGKMQKNNPTIVHVVEKLIELDSFLQVTYSAPSKKSFARDLSCSQKKNVLKAWQFIENHPKININNFFTKVLGYIKCMENQLWIWGFYRFTGDVTEELINATNFSIVSNDVQIVMTNDQEVLEVEDEDGVEEPAGDETEVMGADGEVQADAVEETTTNAVVMEAVIDENGGFVLQEQGVEQNAQFENAFLKYVYKE